MGVSTFRFCIRSKKWWWPFFEWAVNTWMTNVWNHFCTLQMQKVDMLEFQREVVMIILASFGRNKPARSLAFPRNVGSNLKFDTKNHILVKGTSKYCRCKHCGGTSIYLCPKYSVTLHPDYFKDFHSWNTKLIVFFSARSANNMHPALFSEKFRLFLSYHQHLWSTAVPENLQFFSPVVFLWLVRYLNLVDIRFSRSKFQ